MEGKHQEVAKLLLDKGADVNAQGGRNSLQTASEGGYQDIVKLLLDKGFAMAHCSFADDADHTLSVCGKAMSLQYSADTLEYLLLKFESRT